MKTIDQNTYYQAFGLYILARQYQSKVDIFEKEANKLLNEEEGSHLSDAIYVINKGGYIGESTKREIEYAKKKGKQIYYLEKVKGN